MGSGVGWSEEWGGEWGRVGNAALWYYLTMVW